MTLPRRVLAGTVYLITRRCSERRFLLRPSKALNELFRFTLAVAAQRTGVRIHAFCVMSNHYHLVLTDPRARLPRFAQYLHALVAKATNASLGRWEHFWAPDSYSAVALESSRDVLDKIAYVLANPVSAGLVAHGREWPGLWSAPGLIGGDAVPVPRPKPFFRKNGPLPAFAPLRLHRPECGCSDEEFDARLQERLANAEDAAAARMTAERRAFLGPEWILAQKPSGRPASGEPRRGLKPRVASGDKWKRVEALQRLADFVSSYREALSAWKRGFRYALFPPGTYLLRVAHGAHCAAAG
jgi:REP element-mobilizing transposase RayT